MTLRLAIVGRPNVGKSTLFNRLAGKRLAIVDDTPGVTRDWREAEGHLFDHELTLIDTAGLEESFDGSIEARMRAQTEEALARADVILFLIDGRAGLTPMDEHFAQLLRKTKKPVILGVNKCEAANAAMAGLAEAYTLGFGEPIPMSAAHGEGLHDLYQALQPHFPPLPTPLPDGEREGPLCGAGEGAIDEIEGDLDFELSADEDDPEKPIKIAIVGRPNAGKSTLLNAFLEDNRVMTGPEAGLTRDAIAVDWVYQTRKFKLVDTAGLRKKARVSGAIEKMSVEDTLRAIRLAQIVIFMVDANVMMEKQDLQIADHILNEGRVMVIAVNKWDEIKNKKEALEELQYKLETGMAQVRGVPVVPISALHGRHLGKLMDTALRTYETWNARVPTGKLNRWLSGMEQKNPAPLVSGRPNRLKYIAQINTRPPTFALWISQPKELPDNYRRYITNGLRESFNLPGIPIRLMVRTSKNPYEHKKKKT